MDKMIPKCPIPDCDSEMFAMSPLKVKDFHSTLAAIICIKCNKIITVLDTQADQDVYKNTQKILDRVRVTGDQKD